MLRSSLLFAAALVLCSLDGRSQANIGALATPSVETRTNTQSWEVKTKTQQGDPVALLVGKWRCYARQYVGGAVGPLGSGAEDLLDYLNVYYPYANSNITLRLTSNPEDRPIAAEFLVRRVEMYTSVQSGAIEYRDRLVPMSPQGMVRISRDTIRVGQSPIDDYEFRYHVETRRSGPWLILESSSMRLELFKFTDAPGDVTKSFVRAEIKDYSDDQILMLKQRYEELAPQKALIREP